MDWNTQRYHLTFQFHHFRRNDEIEIDVMLLLIEFATTI